jgi:hypothetical protein
VKFRANQQGLLNQGRYANINFLVLTYIFLKQAFDRLHK